MSTDKIDILGNYSPNEFSATSIVGKNGLAPTVRENHGEVTAITIMAGGCLYLKQPRKVMQ